MGFFDRFRRKQPAGRESELADAEPGDDGEDTGDEDDGGPPVAVAVLREGMSRPTDDDMRTVLLAEAPECVDLPRTGLAQPHWWAQEEWVASGLYGVAKALARSTETDPDLATWDTVRDELGARVAIVYLRRES